MTARSFYRIAVWLPLIVPAAVAFATHAGGWHPDNDIAHEAQQIILMSGLYGGLPYAALAAYGTWWIGGKSEAEIRKRAMVAPLLMAAAWAPFALLLGVLSRQADTFFGLLLLGTAVIMALGYAYVAVVLLLRTAVQPTDGDHRGLPDMSAS